MANAGAVSLSLSVNGSDVFPKKFQTFTIDEHVLHDLTLTSNQSAVTVNFGGVATGQTIFIGADQGITASLNNITAVISTNGWYMQHRTSLASLVVTNDQANAATQVRIVILGT